MAESSAFSSRRTTSIRADSEVRRRAVILGPGGPGFLKIDLGTRGCAGQRIADVDADRAPAALRLPNTHVVAVTGPEGVLRVEDSAEALAKLGIEERVRGVLNEWDPIGVAGDVDDEYDAYIHGVIGLLQTRANDQTLAEHLRRIERERMELPGTPIDDPLAIAARLRRALLPDDASQHQS